ncbi:hypothetical protein N0V88_004979 [Collariella sp. IMI 366227]|nr:hypothetical protein N0V88_004979 [Collariella sp. IMI 366227]
MGFAESFLLSEVSCSDLTAFFTLFIRNRTHLNNGTTLSSSLLSSLSGLWSRTGNTMSKALVNTQAHYDISNEMFAAFLSEDMTYSCPIWRVEDMGREGDHWWDVGQGDETLEQAQMRKIQRFIDGARIKAADHVLEIGSGWGSFAVEAARRTGCRVTTVTLSKEQKIWVEGRVKKEGLAGRVEVLLRDYRDLEAPEEGFDKVVINHITIQSRGTLMVEKIENIGAHYARTLRLWRERFLAKFESKIRPALMREHPDMTAKTVEVFRRKWEYYFAYSEAGFLTKTLGDVIITVGREGAMELMEGIPR